MYDTESEIDNAQAQWMLNRRFTADAKTNALIRGEVEKYLEETGGWNCVQRMPFLNSADPSRINQPQHQRSHWDVIAFIESPRTSASELRRRYLNAVGPAQFRSVA